MATVTRSGVPQEIQDIRKSSTDFHLELGQPVIHKHKWNERDEREGLAQRCPFHNEYYDEDLATCPYCFGTGYLGGYADGVLTFVALADTREDTFRLTPQGLLLHDRSPSMTAPWTPSMGDGDMLITAELDPVTQEVKDTFDRYSLREVTPVSVRGPGFRNTRHSRPYVVNQTGQVDVIPYGSNLQDVPIIFDYTNVPTPLPDDPTKPPIPAGYTYTAHDVAVRITGHEIGAKSSDERSVRLVVSGQRTLRESDVRVSGDPSGTHVFID